VELFLGVVITANIESESVGSIMILEIFCSGRNVCLYILYHIHPAAFNSVELWLSWSSLPTLKVIL
jgi:hypothetical protein